MVKCIITKNLYHLVNNTHNSKTTYFILSKIYERSYILLIYLQKIYESFLPLRFVNSHKENNERFVFCKNQFIVTIDFFSNQIAGTIPLLEVWHCTQIKLIFSQKEEQTKPIYKALA